jgi:hypothetical protein
MGYDRVVKKLAIEMEIAKRVRGLQAKDATLSQVDAEAEVLRDKHLYARYVDATAIQST